MTPKHNHYFVSNKIKDKIYIFLHSKQTLSFFLFASLAVPLPVALYRPQGGMAVSEYNAQMLAIYRRHTGGVFLKDFKKQGCHACVL